MRASTLLIRNHAYGMLHAIRSLRQQSRLNLFILGGFSLGWLAALSALFYAGFDFIHRLGGAGFLLVPSLFTLFFMGLGFMLILSGAVTGYSNLYQSAEVNRLLAWPIALKDLFHYVYIKTSIMSSWAFFFVIVPFLGAYAVHRGWPWYMSFWAFAFSLPFVMIFSGLGMLIAMLFVRWAPRGKVLALIALALLLALVLWGISYSGRLQTQGQNDFLVMVRMIPGLKLASHPLMPNWWMAEGIMALSRAEFGRGLLFLLLLTTTVPVLLLLVVAVGRRIYRSGYQKETVGNRSPMARSSIISRAIRQAFHLRPMLRAFAVKDTMIFLRDPVQWTQFLIFFGLLGIYFLNLRSLGYDDLAPTWNNLIAFLNMFSLSAVMSSLSSRFVYPLMSMEGRTLWLIGVAPTTVARIMMVKFTVTFGGLLLVGVGLGSLSNLMLDIAEATAWIGVTLMPCVAFTLAGMSTGLGAYFMDTRAQNPAQILSGFGGTLNLILTLITVILLVLVPGIVSHLMLLELIPPALAPYALGGVIVYILLIAGLAGGIPLLLGYRRLQVRDY